MQANLLQWIWTRLFLCLLLAAGGAIAHTAETRSSIVVGCGPFPSPRCRQLLSDSLRMALPAAIKARIVEDEECFTYGERTVAYYHACVQALQQLNVGRRDAARPPYAEAQRLAELLRNDAVSTQNSSSHANVENAFAATGATRALEHIAARLEAQK